MKFALIACIAFVLASGYIHCASGESPLALTSELDHLNIADPSPVDRGTIGRSPPDLVGGESANTHSLDSEQSFHFLALPTELQHQILGAYLSSGEFARYQLQHVSRNFNSLLESHIFNAEEANQLAPALTKHLMKQLRTPEDELKLTNVQSRILGAVTKWMYPSGYREYEGGHRADRWRAFRIMREMKKLRRLYLFRAAVALEQRLRHMERSYLNQGLYSPEKRRHIQSHMLRYFLEGMSASVKDYGLTELIVEGGSPSDISEFLIKDGKMLEVPNLSMVKVVNLKIHGKVFWREVADLGQLLKDHQVELVVESGGRRLRI